MKLFDTEIKRPAATFTDSTPILVSFQWLNIQFKLEAMVLNWTVLIRNR